jgi:FkbM family methyltransferase
VRPLAVPLTLRLLRAALAHWPVPGGRGRGVLLRAVLRAWGRRPLVMDLEPGIVVPVQREDYMAMHHFVEGFSRDPAFELSRRLIAPGDTVIDVGANLGFWVLGAALRAGPQGRVHAFEPVAANLERLRLNAAANGISWVQSHALALGDREGEVSFLPPASTHSGRGRVTDTEEGGTIRVPATTLDAFCAAGALDAVHFVKVDVEGAELAVLRGGADLLARPHAPVVMFEVGDGLAAAHGTTTRETKQYLVDRGFGLARYAQGRLHEVGAHEPHPESEDLVALRPEHYRRHPWLGTLRGW